MGQSGAFCCAECLCAALRVPHHHLELVTGHEVLDEGTNLSSLDYWLADWTTAPTVPGSAVSFSDPTP